jgi:hypothetical protein
MEWLALAEQTAGPKPVDWRAISKPLLLRCAILAHLGEGLNLTDKMLALMASAPVDSDFKEEQLRDQLRKASAD